MKEVIRILKRGQKRRKLL